MIERHQKSSFWVCKKKINRKLGHIRFKQKSRRFQTSRKLFTCILTLLLLFVQLSVFGKGETLAAPRKTGFTTFNFNIEPNGYFSEGDLYTDDFSDHDGFMINLARTDGQSMQGDSLSARMKIYQSYSCGDGTLYMTSIANPIENYQGETFVNTQQPDFTDVAPNAGWSRWVTITGGAFYGLIFIHGQPNSGVSCGTQITLEVMHNAGSQPPPPPEPENPPEANFWADDYDITVPNCTYLRWDTSNAAGVTLDYENVGLSDSRYVCPTSTTTYRLDVFGQNGQSTLKKVTINVQSPPPPPQQPAPSISFWADNTNISSGQCTNLRWDISNASYVSLDNNYEQAYGSRQVCPNQTTTYTLYVTGTDGMSYTQSVTVQVSIPLSAEVNFYADVGSLKAGECTLLHWQVSNAAGVTLDYENVGSSGSQSVCPTSTTTYRLDVFGSDGKTIQATVTIYVEAQQIVPSTVQFYADQTELQAGECTFLRWSTTNALEIELDGDKVNQAGERQVCPKATTTYDLNVVDQQGQLSQTVAITVIEKVEVKPQECQDISNNILIVTNSRKLNQSTGNGASWDEVKKLLQDYYQPADGACAGAPVFLDLDLDVGGAFDDDATTDYAIENYISQHFTGYPAAVVIIGGPNVIPYGEIDVSNDILDPVLSDDIYADFDHDKNNIPDAVITRLPDGHSYTLLVSYITRLSYISPPPTGSTMVIPFHKASELLVDPNPLIIRTVTGQAQKTNSCYLENYLQAATGSNKVLMSPPWLLDGSKPSKAISDYLPANDAISQKGALGANLSSEISGRDAVFVGLTLLKKARWSSMLSDGSFYDVFGIKEATSLPQGVNVFAMVNFGADLTYWAVGETAQDSIPLALLETNAHHFIGTTDEVYSASLTTSLPSSGATSISSLDVNQYDLAFAKTYFSMKCARMGAAENFWAAKNQFAVNQLADPTYRRSLHAYIYYGLPEKFNSTVNSCQIMDALVSCQPPDLKSIINTGDADLDGLSQVEEEWIANTFKPYYVWDVDEPYFPPSFMYQVTPFDKLPGGSGKGVILSITALYKMDVAYPKPLGFSFLQRALPWHFGDNEVVEIWLTQSQSACNGQWEHAYQGINGNTCYSMQRMMMHGHGGTFQFDVHDQWGEFAQNTEFVSDFDPGVFGTHVVLYISKGKHAAYFREWPTCDESTYDANYCWTIPGIKQEVCLNKSQEICSNRTKSEAKGRAFMPYLTMNQNVGESYKPLITKMSENIFLSDFPCEEAWGKEQFCGGYRSGENCDSSQLHNVLQSLQIKIFGQTVYTTPEHFMDLPVCGGINYDHWCGPNLTNSYCGRNLADKGTLHVE